MCILIKLGGGRQVFVERATWLRSGRDAAWPDFHCRREGGEWLIWFGRLHMIYTPRPRSGAAGWTRERSYEPRKGRRVLRRARPG